MRHFYRFISRLMTSFLEFLIFLVTHQKYQVLGAFVTDKKALIMPKAGARWANDGSRRKIKCIEDLYTSRALEAPQKKLWVECKRSSCLFPMLQCIPFARVSPNRHITRRGHTEDFISRASNLLPSYSVCA